MGKKIYLFCKKNLALILAILFFYLVFFFAQKVFIRKFFTEVTGRVMHVSNFLYEQSLENLITFYHRYFRYQNLYDENIELKLQILDLTVQNKEYVSIRDKYNQLITLLEVIENEKQTSELLIAKVIGGARNLYSDFLVINLGTESKVEVGNFVKSSEGIIGKVTQVSDNYSVITLISDVKSKISVVTEKSRISAILGRDKNDMRLFYVINSDHIFLGEAVFSLEENNIRGDLLGYVSSITADRRVLVNLIPFGGEKSLDFVLVKIK